jgi:hypothetical protein
LIAIGIEVVSSSCLVAYAVGVVIKLGLEFIHRYIFFKDTSGRCIGFIEEEAKTVDTTPIKATRYKHNATQITTQPTTTERQ